MISWFLNLFLQELQEEIKDLRDENEKITSYEQEIKNLQKELTDTKEELRKALGVRISNQLETDQLCIVWTFLGLLTVLVLSMYSLSTDTFWNLF